MDKNYTLTPEQQKMAEENMDLVDILLHTRVTPNESIRGMEYDELYQYGCIALCHAVATYDGRAKFRTYATHVIYNALIDQCRYAQHHHARSFSYDTPADDSEDTHEIFIKDPRSVDESLMEGELLNLLQSAKSHHTGVIRKGLEAIEFQLHGYSGAEIADIYGVQNNHVTSWISKARAALRKDFPDFGK